MMHTREFRRAVMLLAVGLYAASLMLPAYSFVSHVPPDPIVGQTEIYPGWAVLAYGPMGMVFLQRPAFAWFANSTFLVGMLFYGSRRYGKAAVLAIASAVFGASFFWISKSQPMPVIFSGRDDLMNHPVPMLGFYLWITAFAVLCLGSVLAKFGRGLKADIEP